MTRKTIALSINACWNIVNFRTGLIRSLQSEGYRIVALAPLDEYSEKLHRLGVDHVPIPMDKKGISPARDAILLIKYFKELRKLRPDAFLGFTIKPNIYGSLAANVLGIPVINNITGLGTAFIRQTWLTQLVAWLYRIALRRSSTVFFQNEEDLGLFIGRRLVAAEKARLLPGSGIDLNRFRPLAGPGGEGVTFLLVARLMRDKGVLEFVEAARIVRDCEPRCRFQLLGFLDVDNRTAITRAELDRWVDEGVIEYLGHADDVRPYLSAASCVVLPSYREGLPRSLLEAAAMAKPLIATDVPGCRQLVAHGINGFLCAPGDSASLAGAMSEFVRLDEVERARFGAASRNKAEREYDEREVFRRYLLALRVAIGAI